MRKNSLYSFQNIVSSIIHDSKTSWHQTFLYGTFLPLRTGMYTSAVHEVPLGDLLNLNTWYDWWHRIFYDHGADSSKLFVIYRTTVKLRHKGWRKKKLFKENHKIDNTLKLFFLPFNYCTSLGRKQITQRKPTWKHIQ